jgi:hypothetical protein
MAKAQFARVHTYTPKTLGGILAEADRQEGATSHIEAPKPPKWITGSRDAVIHAVDKYMAQPATVRLKNGQFATRKRRSDHRCMIAGVLSWPDSIADLNHAPLDKIRANQWIEKSCAWLKQQYGEDLIAVCLHTDESHPHLHFFVVGDAQRIHPGMRAELVDDSRMTDNKARMVAHKAGLKSWLNDYHESVNQHFGLERTLNARPAWRIKDRGTREKLFEIDKQLKARPDIDIQAQRNAIWDDSEKTERPDMKY